MSKKDYIIKHYKSGEIPQIGDLVKRKTAQQAGVPNNTEWGIVVGIVKTGGSWPHWAVPRIYWNMRGLNRSLPHEIYLAKRLEK